MAASTNAVKADSRFLPSNPFINWASAWSTVRPISANQPLLILEYCTILIVGLGGCCIATHMITLGPREIELIIFLPGKAAYPWMTGFKNATRAPRRYLAPVSEATSKSGAAGSITMGGYCTKSD